MSLLAGFAALVLLKGPPAIGDSIPSFQLQSSVGTVTYKHRNVTVLTFCAFWCDTWKQQLPRIRETQNSLAGMPVDFMTISVDGRWSELGRRAAVGTSLSDNGGVLTKKLGVDRVPYTLLLDQAGKLRWVSYGVLRSSELTSKVRQVLNGGSDGGDIYLTFDDFPANRLNDELLDVLRAKKVPATFFCICSKLDDKKLVTSRAVREGHELEVHAWKHDEPSTDLDLCRRALRGFGVKPSLFRKAGAEGIATFTGSKLGFRTVDPYDFKRPSPAELERRTLYGVRADSVIQLHAGVQETIDALPRIIDSLRGRGFTFKLVRSETD